MQPLKQITADKKSLSKTGYLINDLVRYLPTHMTSRR